MKILVTGGSGLVGFSIKKLCDQVNNKFVFVSSKDYDLTDISQVDNMFKTILPDSVIHLGANVGGLYKNMNYNLEIFESNLIMNFNILKKSHQHNVQKVISCLSTCIFPNDTIYPIDENMIHNGKPHDSNYGYSYAKRMLEVQSRLYREKYKRDYICIIPTNIYGENDNYNLENSHVIPALIHKCYLAKRNKEKFIIKGSGKPLRQFIFSDDLAKIILEILFSKKKFKNIILSVDENDEISIGEVGRLIASKFDYINNIKFDLDYSDGQFKKTANNNLFKKYFTNFKFLNINQGLDITIKYFIENFDNIRK